MRSIVVSRLTPTLTAPPSVSTASVIVPCAWMGCVWSLIVSSPSSVELVAVAEQIGRVKSQLRVTLGVEEVRRAEVGLEVLVLDGDRVGADAADQLRGAVRLDGEAGVEVVKVAAERRDAHVFDGEAGRGVRGVKRPGSDRKLCGGGGDC